MILDKFRLDGQVAVVTGAGRGLGAAIAVAFAEVGADVVIASRTQSELESVAAQIEAIGRRAHIVVADLAHPETTAELAGRPSRRSASSTSSSTTSAAACPTR